MTTVRYINGHAALAAYMNDRVATTQGRLASGGHNTSKALSNSVSADVADGLGHTTGTLYAAHYWRWAGNGRGPGKPPPLDRIQQWVRQKGLASTDQTVYRLALFIRSRIAKYGTLDYRLGGENLFLKDYRESAPRIADTVLPAFIRDYAEANAQMFTKAYAA